MTACPRQQGPGLPMGPRANLRVRGRLMILGPVLVVQVFGSLLFAQSRPDHSLPAATAPSSTAPGERLLTLIPTLTGEGTPAERRQAAIQILQLGNEEAAKALAAILVLKNNSAAKLAVCEAVADTENPP